MTKSAEPEAATGESELAVENGEDGFLDAEALLKRLPVSPGTLANWRKAGKIPYVKVARRIVFHWPSVQAALLRQQRGGGL